MLFEKRLREGLAGGEVTLALRRWRRPQVTAGGVYRTGAPGSRVEAVAVEVVTPADLTPADARDAGYPDVAALLASVRGGDDLPLHRIRFRVVEEPDPRAALGEDDALTDEDVERLRGRLDRLDAAPTSPGAWTRATLALLDERPGVVSTELADALGQERFAFKKRVRSLKALGLTESLAVGYRLTPRGRALLAALAGPGRS